MRKRGLRPAEALAGASRGRLERLCDGSVGHPDAIAAISSALASRYGGEIAREIAFHVSDAIADMAALLALHVSPATVTEESIREVVDPACLAHIANHLLAAAHLSGLPADDVFELGIRVPPES